jgi:hypothetical protein
MTQQNIKLGTKEDSVVIDFPSGKGIIIYGDGLVALCGLSVDLKKNSKTKTRRIKNTMSI